MNIQSLLISLSNGMCLAASYLYAVKKEDEETNRFIVKHLLDAVDKGYVKEDGYVVDAVSLLKLATDKNVNVNVVKKDIVSLNDLIGKKACVRYDYNGYSHWVYVENGKIKFNSLDYSNCVSKGEPTTARVLQISILDGNETEEDIAKADE